MQYVGTYGFFPTFCEIRLEAGSVTLATKGNGGTNTTTGNLNIGGGSFTVNSGGSFTMATNASTNASGSATGNLNVTGGVFTSNVDIVRGGGTNPSSANITLDGGTIDMTGKNIADATNAINLTAASGTLRNVAEINGGTSGLTKTTSGTLILEGTNTYTGATAVNVGKLIVNGNQPLATGATTVAAGTTTGNPVATLSGNGGIGGSLSLAAESASSFKKAVFSPLPPARAEQHWKWLVRPPSAPDRSSSGT